VIDGVVGDDRDSIDGHAQLLVAMSCLGGQPDQVVGTVRIHRDGARPGTWWGSRLAVHAAFRHQGQLGATLIRLAVGRARAQGCERFLAHVQAPNETMFQKLHWHTLAAVTLHGRPHVRMQAALGAYPACHDPLSGYVTRGRAPRAQA
jgi:putative N-acetyltransferase (TIGR04045 family)